MKRKHVTFQGAVSAVSASNRIKKLKETKVQALRDECQRLGLDKCGNKQDLTERILQNSMEETRGRNSPVCDDSFGPNEENLEANIAKEIRVRLYVRDLLSIDIPGHRFTASFSMEVSWEIPENELELYDRGDDEPSIRICQDTRAGKSVSSSNSFSAASDHSFDDELGTFSGRHAWESDTQFPPIIHDRKGLKLRWTPRLIFGNCLELDQKHEYYKDYEFDEESGERLVSLGRLPVICYRLRAVAVFQEKFELGAFPLDSQDCQIVIISKHHRQMGNELSLIKNKNNEKYESRIPVDRFLIQEQYENQQLNHYLNS